MAVMVKAENTEKETRKLGKFSSRVPKLEGNCPYEIIAVWKSVKRLSFFWLECTWSAAAVAQWVRALATKACWLQFDSWNPGQRKRTSSQELSSKGQVCPMGCASEDINTHSHHVHTALVNKSQTSGPWRPVFHVQFWVQHGCYVFINTKQWLQRW